MVRIKAGPGGGPIVRRPSPADLAEELTLILQFEGATGGDLLAARRSLEPTVARAAAAVIKAEQVTELREANDQLLERIDDEWAFLEANRLFHRIIARASGNVVLEMYATSLVTLADGRQAGVTYALDTRGHVHRQHEKILAALAAHDAPAAEAAMTHHIAETERYWRRNFPEMYTRPVRWTA
jgi:DNA-binding FadR family transcriptional regulator